MNLVSLVLESEEIMLMQEVLEYLNLSIRMAYSKGFLDLNHSVRI